MGAPEFIAGDADATKWTNQGLRVLALTRNDELAALIICRESIRESARQNIEYFTENGVDVHIVSGDNENTVRYIAQKVGVLPGNVVGRAKPETKIEIVRKMQKEGYIVAMTGDGVNDMLALKEADLGIAMGNAAASTKAVANLVLIDSDFSKLPAVVAQGRRVIANIERVASLFLTKTFYSIGLTLTTILLATDYPFLPRHLTVVSALTIGIPAFFLALPPNSTRYTPGFLRRVLLFSLPAGCIATVAITITREVWHSAALSVMVLLVIGFSIVLLKARPLLNARRRPTWKLLMVGALITVAVLLFCIPWTAEFFALMW
jgi:cation-transporting ATPase E